MQFIKKQKTKTKQKKNLIVFVVYLFQWMLFKMLLTSVPDGNIYLEGTQMSRRNFFADQFGHDTVRR